jgi:hypothetical protein
MSCKSSLCLRCAKVYVDNWVSQVSQMLHAGVIYRHIVLTVPEMLRKTFYQQGKNAHSIEFSGRRPSSFTMRLKLSGVTSMVGHTRQRPDDLGVAYA